MTVTKLTYFNFLNSIHSFKADSGWLFRKLIGEIISVLLETLCSVDMVCVFLCLGVLFWIPWSVGAFGVLSSELSDLPRPLDPWTKTS